MKDEMMSTAKLNWTVEENGSDMFGHQVIGNNLANTSDTNLILHQGHDLATAKLIAAAPALIEALRVCLDYFESVPEREVSASSEAYVKAKAAIAIC